MITVDYIVNLKDMYYIELEIWQNSSISGPLWSTDNTFDNMNLFGW